MWSQPGVRGADGGRMSHAVLPLPSTAPGINRRVKPLEIPNLVLSTTPHAPALY